MPDLHLPLKLSSESCLVNEKEAEVRDEERIYRTNDVSTPIPEMLEEGPVILPSLLKLCRHCRTG